MTDTRTNITKQNRDAKGRVLPKVTDTPIKPVVDALNSALIAIRTKHPEIPNVVLVVGASSAKKYGHFSPKSWESKGASHEIMLSGESLKRGADATLGTLIHECAHALAEKREIKDTSRQGRFHNAKFKALAEELGIEVEKDPVIGWSITTMPKATAALYKLEIAGLKKALTAYRIPESAKVAKPKTTVKIECGCRSVTVPISFVDKGDITCDECGETFIKAE